MSYLFIYNVYISIDMLAILFINAYKFIFNVYISTDILVILIKNLFKNHKVQTTSNLIKISAYHTSNRRIAAAYANSATPRPTIGNIEMDTHTDTIVAGANCCILEYTGRICDVSPYSSDYSPVIGVPIVKAATVW